jgi:predicted phosphoribosyltransferase
VVVVDDGVATGATAIAAVRSVRAAGARPVIFAAPVAHPHAVELLRRGATVVCPEIDPGLVAVGQYYRDFSQVEDAEVRRLIARAEPGPEAGGPPSRTG